MNRFDLINVPADTLDRLLMGKATDGDQLLAHNAILAALQGQATPTPATGSGGEASCSEIPKGWVAVPREPTEEMLAAASARIKEVTVIIEAGPAKGATLIREPNYNAYRAMIEAAPTVKDYLTAAKAHPAPAGGDAEGGK